MNIIDIPYKKCGRPSKRPAPEVLVELYGKYTSTEIGKMYDVPSSTVRSWIAALREEATRK